MNYTSRPGCLKPYLSPRTPREFFQEMDASGVPDIREGVFTTRPGYRWRLDMEEMSIEGVKKLKLDVASGAETVSVETYRLTE